MPEGLKRSDICVTIRMLRECRPEVFGNVAAGSLPGALALLKQARPTRLEWSYIDDRQIIDQFKGFTPVFVAALNTKDGHARSFDGQPIIAPWMRYFGAPDNRFEYICQNNPADLQSKIDRAVRFIKDGITQFHFDDWYCNAQMILFRNPCFCEHCRREFAVEMGLSIDYHAYLRGRGIDSLETLLAAAARDEVPLWHDYGVFQRRTVTRYFRRLKAGMNRAWPDGVTLSVNGQADSTREDVGCVMSSIDYLNGEVRDISTASLQRLADAARRRGILQIALICPYEKEDDNRDTSAWIGRTRQAIGVSYCLGLVPLFPYDVYMGSDDTGRPMPRWYGTWEEFGAPFEVVRAHPDWFDDFDYESLTVEADGSVTVVSTHRQRPAVSLVHTVGPDGDWRIRER